VYGGVLGNWELACRRKELPNLCGSWRQKLGNINVDKWAIDLWLTMRDAITGSLYFTSLRAGAGVVESYLKDNKQAKVGIWPCFHDFVGRKTLWTSLISRDELKMCR
jgi:hypothetical protein